MAEKLGMRRLLGYCQLGLGNLGRRAGKEKKGLPAVGFDSRRRVTRGVSTDLGPGEACVSSFYDDCIVAHLALA